MFLIPKSVSKRLTRKRLERLHKIEHELKQDLILLQKGGYCTGFKNRPLPLERIEQIELNIERVREKIKYWKAF